MNTHIQIYGIISIIIGTVILLWIRKRIFERSTWGGTQVFKNFYSFIFIKIVEFTFRIAGWLILAFGIFMLLIAYFNAHF